MNAIDIIRETAQKIGYRREAVVSSYAFADVLSSASSGTRDVPLAIFTQTPPSYRSAAMAAVSNDDAANELELVMSYRALGAPLLFVISGEQVSVWQVRGAAPPRQLDQLKVSNLAALFERNSDNWRPDVIHRAKSVGLIEGEYQLDFVDIGLLSMIETEVHSKLDRLLVDAFAAAKNNRRRADGIDTRLLYRIVFRLLAAKVLQDRNSDWATKWDADNLTSVLHGIESLYSLEKVPNIARNLLPAFEAVWSCFRGGINFANISADDLAFVYENTLITPETRKLFGTHSTPRQIAEYIVPRLELHKLDPELIKIYEPCTGAGVFLVSALRHLRDLLPVEWSDQRRHKFLTSHIGGSEIEPFACEVAKLSLILADYPNHNGWKIVEEDLFEGNLLDKRMKEHNVILCNPPFENFSADERKNYNVTELTFSKPTAVLNAALRSHPLCMGFVLPRPFVVEAQFSEQRRQLERLYTKIEIVELPDRIFNASSIEASLVIASERRGVTSRSISLRSTNVEDRDRVRFLRTGEISSQRQISRKVGEAPAGDLWIPRLFDLWTYLKDYPNIGAVFQPHLGARWTYDQALAVSNSQKKGFKPGVFNAEDVQQFSASKISYLDLNPDHLTHALDRDWSSPKIIANAVRTSRGPWRLAAVVDRNGLTFSQQLLGLWPLPASKQVSLESYAAVLNGPVANAFLSTRYPAHRFRLSAFKEIPLPPTLPLALNDLVNEYVSVIDKRAIFDDSDARASRILESIDAMILAAYDLPTKLENQLLDLFVGARRPTRHAWVHWNGERGTQGLRLSERVEGRFHPYGGWVTKIFDPLPESEADKLRIFGE